MIPERKKGMEREMEFEKQRIDSQEEIMEQEKTDQKKTRPMSPYERTRAAVYATGNRWAIENFKATH